MKKRYLYVSGIMILMSTLIYTTVKTNVAGPPAARSGAPGEQTCASQFCHSGTVNSGPGTTSITSDIPQTGYVPGNTYTITATVSQSGGSRFGFEIMAAYNAIANDQVGTAVITDANGTQIKTGLGKDYVTHKSAGTTGTDSLTWTFDWTAPNPGVGEVVFYGAFNAANNNQTASGDNIYTDSLAANQQPVGFYHNHLILAEVFPTVTEGAFNVRMVNIDAGEYQVNVFDLNGKTVASKSIDVRTGGFIRTFDITGSQPGIYFVQVTGNDFNKTSKVLIQ